MSAAEADQCREYAKECLRWAEDAENEEERQAFLAMAEHWVEAALTIKGVLAPDKTEPLPFDAALRLGD